MLTPLSKGQWQDLWNEVTLYVGNTQAELAGHPCGETQPEETILSGVMQCMFDLTNTDSVVFRADRFTCSNWSVFGKSHGRKYIDSLVSQLYTLKVGNQPVIANLERCSFVVCLTHLWSASPSFSFVFPVPSIHLLLF